MGQNYSYIMERLSKKTSLFNQVINKVYSSYLNNLPEGENPIKESVLTSMVNSYVDWSAVNNRELSNLAGKEAFIKYMQEILEIEIDSKVIDLFSDCIQAVFPHYDERGAMYFNRDTNKFDVFVFEDEIELPNFNNDEDEEDDEDFEEDEEDDVFLSAYISDDDEDEDSSLASQDSEEQEFDKETLLSEKESEPANSNKKINLADKQEFDKYVNDLSNYIQSLRK